jgi:hypothetical protein
MCGPTIEHARWIDRSFWEREKGACYEVFSSRPNADSAMRGQKMGGEEASLEHRKALAVKTNTNSGFGPTKIKVRQRICRLEDVELQVWR